MSAPTSASLTRRKALSLAAAVAVATGLAACGDSSSPGSAGADNRDQELTPFSVQEVWLPSNLQMGHEVAKAKGFYAEEGLDVTLTPGGPNIDGVANVASGTHDVGLIGSSPSILLAASSGIPIVTVATELQEHPGAFVSKGSAPITSAQDMIGKKIGTQATSEVHLRALLAQNNVPWEEIEHVVIGSDTIPVITGQVDAAWAFITNQAQLAPFEGEYEALRLWDAGIKYYSSTIYTSQKTLDEKPEAIEGFVRATAKGWLWTRDNLDEAIDILIEAHPSLDREQERAGAETLLSLMFTDATEQDGWGTMDPDTWASQIQIFDELGQFEGPVPNVEDLMTLEVLEATKDARETS